MSLRENVREELRRGPITVGATVLGVLVATLALLIAWLQYAGSPAAPSFNTLNEDSRVQLRLSNLLVVFSFFLAASLSSASLIRILDRLHPFPAMILSMPAAVLASFFTMLVFALAPPRVNTPDSLDAAMDIVFWGTLLVFVAINGSSAIRELPTRTSEPKESPSSDPHHPDGLSSFVGAVLMLAVWGTLVWAGLSKLVALFLK